MGSSVSMTADVMPMPMGIPATHGKLLASHAAHTAEFCGSFALSSRAADRLFHHSDDHQWPAHAADRKGASGEASLSVESLASFPASTGPHELSFAAAAQLRTSSPSHQQPPQQPQPQELQESQEPEPPGPTSPRRLSRFLRKVHTCLFLVALPTRDESSHCFLERVFGLLDTAKRHVLSQEDLSRDLFLGHPPDSFPSMFSAADADRDGYLNVTEFCRFFSFVHIADCPTADGDNTVGSYGKRRDAMGWGLSTPTTATPPLPRSAAPNRLRGVAVEALPSQAGRIKCVAASPRHHLYAVSHRNDRVAHVYDAASGVEVRRLVGHADSLLSIAFCPRGKFIATASRDRHLILWDSVVGVRCNTLPHLGIVTAVAFSHTGDCFYTGCQDDVVRRFSTHTGRLRRRTAAMPQGVGVTVALATQNTRNEKIVFSRSCSSHAYVADALSLRLLAVLDNHQSLIWEAAFSPDDEKIMTYCVSRITIWSTDSHARLASFDAAAMSPKGTINPSWTTAVFGPTWLGNKIFAFNAARQLLLLDVDHPQEGPLIDLQFRSIIYTATVLSPSSLLCGDGLGNMYRVLLR